jgi:glycogen debranching enzyme
MPVMMHATSPLPPSIVRDGAAPEVLGRTEWLLTNGLGGFAMGTALGPSSRRYHGLLIASLRPPVQRVMTLHDLAESVIVRPNTPGEQRVDLSTFRFRPGELHPQGYTHLVRFERGISANWHYRVGGTVRVHKRVTLAHGRNAVGVKYTITGDGQSVRLVLRPLVALRDFHALILRDTSRDWFRTEASPANPRLVLVQSPAARVFLQVDHGLFTRDEHWWYNFQYDTERDRGFDYLEDLFNPGSFTADLVATPEGASVTLSAGAESDLAVDTDAEESAHRARLGGLIERAVVSRRGSGQGGQAGQTSEALARLVMASDDFVVRRARPPKGDEALGAGSPGVSGASGVELDRATIIAGYPWFADWGRDSMISISGLLLSTRRFDEARGVLRTFAGACSQGLVPNLFDDYTGRAQYNTVDASLWFVHACCAYLRASGDAETFKRELLPVCAEIVAAYRDGAPFNIKVDPSDGLVSAGDSSTQLTWMDAKRDGVTFTPRQGKAIEINALWYHALRSLAELDASVGDAKLSAECARLGDRAGASLRTLFWNASAGCCYDTLTPRDAGWEAQGEIRPNQLLAVSLKHSALSPEQQRSVVRVVRDRLLTAHAVRTLDPADPRYRGRYRGRMFDRDAAYHNGTSWPWLLGPYAEAVLRAGGFSPEAKRAARDALGPITAFLGGDCPGQLPEVFDGDDTSADPQRAGGCPAQAWSVAEVLRVWMLIEQGE